MNPALQTKQVLFKEIVFESSAGVAHTASVSAPVSEVPPPPVWQDYLRDFWPDLQAAQELHGSICQALQEKESEGSQKEFAEHLPAEILEAGIKSGRYLKVQGWWKEERTVCLVFVDLVSAQWSWTAPLKSCINDKNGGL